MAVTIVVDCQTSFSLIVTCYMHYDYGATETKRINLINPCEWTSSASLFMASMFLYRTKLKMLFATESPFPISLNICCIVEDIHWKQTSADVNISFKTIALNKYLRAVSNMEIYIPHSAQWTMNRWYRKHGNFVYSFAHNLFQIFSPFSLFCLHHRFVSL